MSKLLDQWIDLFRAGDYSSKGKGVFTDKDLQQIVANYDASQHEAPATVGHVEDESKAPAFGWFDKLRVVGDKLQGQMRQIVPAFEELLKQGVYKKRSVGLYHDDKGWSLRHVAFLGGQVPEVKGLADIAFEQKDKEAIEIEFSEENDMADEQKIADNVWERLKTKLGLGEDKGTKTFSEADVARIAGEAAKSAAEEAVKPLQKKLDDQGTEFAEAQKRLATNSTKQRAIDAVNKLKTSGKWVPAFEKMGVPILFDELAKSTETVEFGEADATTKVKPKVQPLEIAVAFFEGLKKIVPSEAIFSGQQVDGAVATSDINKNGRAQADANSVQLDKEVKAYMSEKKTDYGTALTAVAKKHPHLTKPGGSAGGEV